jgi:hypothetical protein
MIEKREMVDPEEIIRMLNEIKSWEIERNERTELTYSHNNKN